MSLRRKLALVGTIAVVSALTTLANPKSNSMEDLLPKNAENVYSNMELNDTASMIYASSYTGMYAALIGGLYSLLAGNRRRT